MNLNKNVLPWLVTGLIVLVLFTFFQNSQSSLKPDEAAYSEFVTRVKEGKVQEVTVQGREIVYVVDGGKEFETYLLPDEQFYPRMEEQGVKVNSLPPDTGISFLDILITWFPILLLIGFWLYMMRGMTGGGARGMGIGKSKAKMLTPDKDRVTFQDVAGIEEAKQDVEEIVEYLREPGKFQRLGGRIPKGVLLVGPPGTGKTLLARAIAGEANVPFFSIAGSDFVEMFVGVGASRVRDMFEQAKKNAPCIIFVDEIDAVGRSRSQGMTGGHEEREQTLNQLLVEMDGFEANEGIILVAATNRADILDKALLRPGRFDRQVTVPLPDVLGREKILEVHTKKVPLSPNVNLNKVARGTPGFSGAELANLVNEAALRAARNNQRVVTYDDLDYAKDKITMGPERKSMARDEEELIKTAYHEAGHAIVALNVPVRDQLNKLTIIPRGQALGYAQFLPEKDSYNFNVEQSHAYIAMAFGGRIAEELIYGADKVTNGASMDIKQATKMARMMIEEWGFSDKIGPLFYGKEEMGYFPGSKDVSDEYAALIDSEVRAFIEQAEHVARQVLTDNLEGLHRLKDALMEYETLSSEEVQLVLEGGTIVRQDDSSLRPPRSSLPSGGAAAPATAPINPEPQPQ